MAFNQLVTFTVDGTGFQVTGAKTYSGEGNTQLNVPVAANATEIPIIFELDITQIKSFAMVCDKDLKVEFNQIATPVPQINLIANVPFIETTDNYYTSKFTADITEIFLTEENGVACTFKLTVVYDPTV